MATKAVPSRYRRSVDSVVAACTKDALYCTVPEAKWDQYFATIPKPERNKELAKRRLGTSVRDARSKALCLYCWMPIPACCCDEIPNFSQDLEKAGCLPVFVFHAEEFLRRSNSGHIAAMLFDAPLVVEGLEEHMDILGNFSTRHPDDYFSLTAPPDAAAPASSADEAGNSTPKPFRASLLFPAPTATDLNVAVADAVSNNETLVLGLLDGTWNQGNAMNRRMPPTIQRTIINIPTTYVSLFAPIREQTRSSGVSTLEATVMGVVSLIRAQGNVDRAQVVEESCTRMMKVFVDIVRQQKHLDSVYPEVSKPIIERIQAPLNLYVANRHKDLVASVETQSSTHRLTSTTPAYARYAPVLQYCYCCDAYVGFSRMDLHVSGLKHQEAHAKNPTWEPSPSAYANVRMKPGRDDSPGREGAPRPPQPSAEC